MKLTFTLCIGALMVATSCQKSTVVPAATKQSFSSSELQNLSASGATSFSDRFDLDLASVGVAQASPCTGELMKIVSGTFHADTHVIINNNKMSVSQHGGTSDYKLIGLTSGAHYTASIVGDQHQDVSLINGSATIVTTESTMLTTPGGKNNWTEKFDLHETFYANGTVTAFVDNFRAGCN